MATTKTALVTISDKFTLAWNDFGKAFIVAVLTTPVTTLLTSLQAGNFDINWKSLGVVAVSSAAAYLLKNLFSTTTTLANSSTTTDTTFLSNTPKN